MCNKQNNRAYITGVEAAKEVIALSYILWHGRASQKQKC